jgi:hypothetical protein
VKAVWIAVGVTGVVLLVPFETPVTLALGVVALLAFVALGATVIASPEFLERDRDEDAP